MVSRLVLLVDPRIQVVCLGGEWHDPLDCPLLTAVTVNLVAWAKAGAIGSLPSYAILASLDYWSDCW